MTSQYVETSRYLEVRQFAANHGLVGACQFRRAAGMSDDRALRAFHNARLKKLQKQGYDAGVAFARSVGA